MAYCITHRKLRLKVPLGTMYISLDNDGLLVLTPGWDFIVHNNLEY